ncbi:MAG: class I SAM-dependent methyltransferase [Flavobacteriaceae bacterium]|nr:class I SAM-dependent methyltransferase [Flavobacteriaceae bacterium]
MIKNSEFFNKLSDDYDQMINFENSLKNKSKTLLNFISPRDQNALDLGCGTGADAIILSKLGLNVDAIDHSKGMLKQAILNAKRLDIEINFIHSSLKDLNLTDKNYNIIVSLGNTIANINRNDLGFLMKKLWSYLSEGGKIVVQIINFAKLPSSGTYLLNTFENDTVSIIRKYHIKPKRIDFIIDKRDKTKNLQSQIITKLYPHSAEDFEKFAKELGFTLEIYGDLNKSPFKVKISSNLVAVLVK